MIRFELTMGRNIPDNGKVTDAMMDEFIKREIMPHFEYGTFIDGIGFWKGEQEQTKIFYLEVADNEVDHYEVIFNCIAYAYKKQFRQDAVMVSQVQSDTVMRGPLHTFASSPVFPGGLDIEQDQDISFTDATTRP